ncbi:MAG: lasso peptide biosynthesis B2 protein [Gemmatimonadales bacterium]|nr:lasso peptide biosynthesis B2 protein [Gemmatimonadales bacterium]
MSEAQQDRPSARWEASPHVRWLDSGDLVTILCLRSGSYLSLTGSAMAMWSGITAGNDRSSLGAQLTTRFDVEPDRLAADLDRFISDCEQRGLIRPAAAPAGNGTRDIPPVNHARRPRILHLLPASLHAWLACLRTSLSLAVGGLPSAYAGATARAAAGARGSADPPPVERLLAAFRRAEMFLISRRGRNDCLPRSLALYSFLRERGCAIRHVIGVCTSPFIAHAWVELGDTPLLHQPHEVARFTPIAVLQ